MKKHILVTALIAAWASSGMAQGLATAPNPLADPAPQVAPTATPSLASPVAAAPVALPNPATGVNPFTGQQRSETELKKTQDQLKQMRTLSTERLALQRDELEALRIELDKKKVLSELNPPKPPEPVKPVEPAKSPEAVKAAAGDKKDGDKSEKKETAEVKPAKPKTRVVRNTRPADITPTNMPNTTVTAEVKPSTPPQVIAPAPTKFEVPEVLGVMDIGGQRVAMMQFDGRTLQAQVGSIVGGQPVNGITPSGIQWGGQFVQVSTKSSVPSVVVTDVRQRSGSAGPAPMSTTPVAAPIASSTPQQFNGYTPPNIQLNPTGVQRTSVGATGPTGVLQLPPPPPSIRP